MGDHSSSRSYPASALRICPERDAVCPHGPACPHVIDRYACHPSGTQKETDQ